MHACMKRRLLFAASQAYQPRMEIHRREVGWIEPPIVIARDSAIGERPIDLALVGRAAEGVVVAFRGTLPPFFASIGEDGIDGWSVMLDWLNGAASLCVEEIGFAGGVHLGFATSLQRLWGDTAEGPGIRTAIALQLDRQQGAAHLFVTGHSKGGALANLAAWRIAAEREWRSVPISVATFAAARAGDSHFARAYHASRIACLRYELPGDPVPLLPAGHAAPGWVRGFARGLGAEVARGDWAAVGLRVAPPGESHRPWPGSRRRGIGTLLGRRGAGLATLAPLAAHAICPGSGYDRLVCLGEPDCAHGRS